MAQLFFHYGTMNCGKSIEILKVAHNYREQGKEVLLLSSSLDNRFGKGVIASRIGLLEDCLMFDNKTDILELFKENYNDNLYCVLIDEAQFLTSEQVESLSDIVDYYDIPVITFGLSTDFQSNLFEGSKRLFEIADKTKQIKTICWVCNKKANFNLRLMGNTPIFEGEQLSIALNADKVDENSNEIGYYPVCRKHYKEAKTSGKLEINKSTKKE